MLVFLLSVGVVKEAGFPPTNKEMQSFRNLCSGYDNVIELHAGFCTA